MAGKVLAALLLLFGGGITIYIVYKLLLGILQPVVQKKLQQQMQKEKLEQLNNNLKLHEQLDQNLIKATQQNTKNSQKKCAD